MDMSSGATASQTTENVGLTLEETWVETNGNGPTWHKRQQWSCEWCCSLAETKPADCAARKRHNDSNTNAYRCFPLRRNVIWITVYRPFRSGACAVPGSGYRRSSYWMSLCTVFELSVCQEADPQLAQ